MGSPFCMGWPPCTDETGQRGGILMSKFTKIVGRIVTVVLGAALVYGYIMAVVWTAAWWVSR